MLFILKCEELNNIIVPKLSSLEKQYYFCQVAIRKFDTLLDECAKRHE